METVFVNLVIVVNINVKLSIPNFIINNLWEVYMDLATKEKFKDLLLLLLLEKLIKQMFLWYIIFFNKKFSKGLIDYI